MEQYGRQHETIINEDMFDREIKGELYFTKQVWNEIDNFALCVPFIFMLMNADLSANCINYS